MNMHKNARLTPLGRERLVEMMRSGQTPPAAARAVGVCPRTARKWLVDIARKAWPACRTALRVPIGCANRPTHRSSNGSSLCAASAGPASTLPARWGLAGERAPAGFRQPNGFPLEIFRECFALSFAHRVLLLRQTLSESPSTFSGQVQSIPYPGAMRRCCYNARTAGKFGLSLLYVGSTAAITPCPFISENRKS